VGRADEIDIVAPLPLEPDHHLRETGGFLLHPFPQMADLEILAEGTSEVAVGDEDRSRTGPSHQGRLFPEMGMITGNNSLSPGTAETFPAGQAVHAAFPGTDPAGFEKAQGLPASLSKNPRIKKVEIGRPSPGHRR